MKTTEEQSDRGETEALARSTGFVNCAGLIGYLPFTAANTLVRTKRYRWHQSCAWGYVLQKVSSVNP
jgi:hypothetical protein